MGVAVDICYTSHVSKEDEVDEASSSAADALLGLARADASLCEGAEEGV